MNKRILAFLMAAAMTLSMAACSSETNKENSGSSDDFTFVENDLKVSALTKEEIKAMKSEPQYEAGLTYLYGSGNCTSAPYVAQKLGLYEQYGIKAEQLKGVATLEALGSNQAQVNINHIATMLVPCTNGVNYTFVAGAHIGCQSLFVLADSEYETTQDLIGKAISAPNGIGNSSYNILSRMLDHDGIDPLNDVEITVVETDACINAMENGEIAGLVTGDSWAYDMVKDGKLRVIRSLMDEDFAQEPCCVVVMNNDFIKENPNMAKAVTECIKMAGDWMRENPEEAVQILMDDNLLSGEMSKHVELWNSLQFGPSDAMAEAALKTIIDDYIRLDLLTSTDDAAAVLDMAWNPLLPDADLGYNENTNDGSWWD
ncbi:MAG: ABC transporter substrate-binding protein [Oscillospiraceae bacterium]|nr:ABC transporter substrate-binding protein [Oscillospiraceae bacterium]